MSKNLLITRPEHDDTTHYLSKWSSKAIDKAIEKGIIVLDLHQAKANRSNVEGMLSKQNPKFAVFNGHGNEDMITGHQNEPILDLKNASLLKGRIVYAVSCRSAKVLGKMCVDEGTAAYIGYDDDFVFVYEPNNISRPLLDKTVKLFLEPSNELIISIIKGNNVEEACNKSRDAFRVNIRQLFSSETSKENTDLVRYLWWDLRHQVCFGEKNASF